MSAPEKQAAAMTEAELREACDRAAQALADLSKAALEARDAGLVGPGLSGDLYYASNRAWQELDRVRRFRRPST